MSSTVVLFDDDASISLKAISKLRLDACISPASQQYLWDFLETPGSSTQLPEWVQHMKDFWQPGLGLEVPEEWTRLILPPKNVEIDKWLPLSLISTMLSSVASELRLIPASQFIDRSESLNYLGPLFPPCHSPQAVDSNSSAILAMVNLLLCEDDDIEVLYRMAAILAKTSGCQLKLRPRVHFALSGTYLTGTNPDLGFALAPQWQPVGKTMIARSKVAPVHFTSPGLVLGVHLEERDGGHSPQDLTKLAHAAQPHLEALLVARHKSSSSASAPPACIFGIAYRNRTVFIVAHIAYLHRSTYRYRSLVVDELPFLPYVSDDRKGLLARLRIIVSLLTIQRHASLSAALWDDVIWPWVIVDYEQNLLREHTDFETPNPSEPDDGKTKEVKEKERIQREADEKAKAEGKDDKKSTEGWGDFAEFISISSESGGEINPTPAEFEHSKNLVDGWLSALDNEIESSMIPWEGSC